jgi:hypothetical protein
MKVGYSITNAIRLDSPRAEQLKVFESSTASADRKVAYPGILQCITLTGVTSTGLVGAHISPGQSPESIRDQCGYLNELGASRCLDWYLVGNIMIHASCSQAKDKGWVSTGSIVQHLKSELETAAPFYAYDTSLEASSTGITGAGLTIAAELIDSGLQISVSFSTYDASDFSKKIANRKVIGADQLRRVVLKT